MATLSSCMGMARSVLAPTRRQGCRDALSFFRMFFQHARILVYMRAIGDSTMLAAKPAPSGKWILPCRGTYSTVLCTVNPDAD